LDFIWFEKDALLAESKLTQPQGIFKLYDFTINSLFILVES